MKRSVIFMLYMLVISMLMVHSAKADSTYPVRRLERAVSWASTSFATAINNHNQVAGRWMMGAIDRSFFWENGVAEDIGDPDLYSLDSWIGGINDLGQTVGYSSHFAAPTTAFLWEHGVTHDLGTLSGDSSIATDINNIGQITGHLWYNSIRDYRAFLLYQGHVTDLGTLGGDSSHATAINEQGHVVGYATTADGVEHAYIWRDGVMTDMGTLGGNWSRALGINDLDQVVGSSPTADGIEHAFRWDGGVMIDLGTLSGGWSRAYGINDLGQVVGTSDWRAFLWEHHAMYDLTSLTKYSSTESYLTSAYAINDLGVIVGGGHFSGYIPDALAYATLPEPSSLLALVSSLGTVGGLTWRRRR